MSRPLLALTLRHPWPWAIYFCGKRLENRNWAPPASLLKPGDWFAIHGGDAPKGRDLDEAAREAEQILDLRGVFVPEGRRDRDAAIIPGIGAVCRFAGTVDRSDDLWFGGPLAWVLDQVVVLPEPVPCRGAQKLWRVPDEVAEKVRKQFKAAVHTGATS